MDANFSLYMDYVFKGAVGLVLALGCYLWTLLVSKVREQGLAIDTNKQDLNDHRLHVSETYAKKDELKPINDSLRDIQNDIKELLGRKRASE